MADSRFFGSPSSISVSDLSERIDCDIDIRGDQNLVLEDVSALDSAGSKDLSFIDNAKYKKAFTQSKAGACFVSPKNADFAPEGMVLLVTASPYKAYALAASIFYPEPQKPAFLSPTAYVDDTADIGNNAHIQHGVYIGKHVKIGDNVYIEPNAVIEDHVVIGDNCRIGSNASVSHALIGNNVRLYPGVRVGQDGFGFAIDPQGHVKVPQLGRVIIEDHVEIGANTTIDRGAGPDTVIGQGTWIDNLVQIGHNVVIGKGCIIVAKVGISGSTKIEDFVAIGGQAGIAGHLKIGAGARIAAQAGVMSDIPAGSEYMGSPAFPKNQFLRQIATLNRLIKEQKKD